MANETQAPTHANRGETRREVEMFAHLQRGASRITVMLKDLTRHGARIEGISGLGEDEAVSLALPGCKPKLAFVAWSNDHCAGLEFAEPLRHGVFEVLVGEYAVNRQPETDETQPPPSGALAA